tara:strand:+ start:874 stop:1092 length:219 start_codon:yes stop_codon:yes gene_type:complete
MAIGLDFLTTLSIEEQEKFLEFMQNSEELDFIEIDDVTYPIHPAVSRLIDSLSLEISIIKKRKQVGLSKNKG